MALRTKKGILFRKDYSICCRIKGEFFDRILKGEKKIEYRFSTPRWDARLKSAQHCLDNGIPVFIKLLCGPEMATLQVQGIGLFHVRLDFWPTVGLVPPVGTDKLAWGILLGDRVGSSLRTNRYLDTLPTRKIRTPAYLEAVQCIANIERDRKPAPQPVPGRSGYCSDCCRVGNPETCYDPDEPGGFCGNFEPQPRGGGRPAHQPRMNGPEARKENGDST